MKTCRMVRQSDLIVPSLGECLVDSPLAFDSPSHDCESHFVTDAMRIRWNVEITSGTEEEEAPLSFEEAGPRPRIFFDPAKTTAAIVTCGGLSPGLNNVVRSVYYALTANYGVTRVLGIRNGYLGLKSDPHRAPIELSTERVREIHKLGGTLLGTSRGPQDPTVMADYLKSAGIDVLFCVGGDGTQRGAHALHEELQRRGAPIAIVGIPKTIDNDIPFVRQSFGYATALGKASEVIRGAHVEASAAIRGIGLVKVMGRHAGFIAAGATVVSQEVNFTLIPEIAFPLEGPDGLLTALEKRLDRRGHAVVVVAEGAGQHLCSETDTECDSSGNLLNQDIGCVLKRRICDHFEKLGQPVGMKYLDPSYHIRSVPASTVDRFLCDQMGRHAVHAGMAGKTGLVIGYEHNEFIHVPIPIVVSQKKQLDLTGDLWRAVLQVTGQPRW